MYSLFKRHMISYGLIVVFNYILLGGAFLYLTNNLAIEEKLITLADTMQKVSDSTISYVNAKVEIDGFLANQALENSYKINLLQLASYSGATIYITDINGVIDKQAVPGAFYYGDGYSALPQNAIQTVLDTEIYNDNHNFSGFLEETHFTQGMPIKDSSGNVYYLVFVSIPGAASMRFVQDTVGIFFFILIIAVITTLIATYISVRQTLKPIQAISRSTQVFSRGDFSIRVPLPKYHDELYTLTDNFNNMADVIEKSENEQRGLIANVSHDLRTPMTTISGFVDGILDGTIKPENQNKYLALVSDEVKRLARLANDMVELSRFQAAVSENSKSSFDITEVVRRIIISFEQKLIDKNISVELDMPDVLNVSANRDSLFRVIYNLTDNAVKFIDQNGTLTISLLQNGNRVVFNIENTGTVIPADKAKNVFDRFYKLDESRGQNKQGAGLGLYIAKSIINQHDGDIFATSLPNSTRFSFDIPIKGN